MRGRWVSASTEHPCVAESGAMASWCVVLVVHTDVGVNVRVIPWLELGVWVFGAWARLGLMLMVCEGCVIPRGSGSGRWALCTALPLSLGRV